MTVLRSRFPLTNHRGLRLVSLIAAAALIPLSAASAGSEKAKDKGIDYTKPFLFDGLFPSERPHMESKPDVKDVRARLAEDGLTSAKRAELLSRAARLEMQRGNREQAERDIKDALETGALTDADKAENYRLLARLHAGKTPPDFEKAVEYQRKSNQIENQSTDRR